MQTIAFLTMSGRTAFETDDQLTIPALAELDIRVRQIPWDQAVGQVEDCDLVVIRSTYDYIHAPEKFLRTLEAIENHTPIANSSSVVAWNRDKRYLAKLQAQGIPMIPSVFGEILTEASLEASFTALDCQTIVIKPTVGASSDGIHTVTTGNKREASSAMATYAGHRPFLMQPFLREIIEEGEYSLFFFDKAYSHAVLKRPKSGDFRVQQEFGGSTQVIQPPVEILELAQKVLCQVSDPLLYARVDIVHLNGRAVLMELELIEPQLFFGMDEQAPRRFANAVARFLERQDQT